MEQQNNKQDEILQRQYGDNVELRTMEVRAEGESDEMRIVGYAAVFNQETDLGYFREMITPGAFDDVMNDDVRLLLNHDGAPLARTTNGTLSLSVDDEGLRYEGVLSDTTQGRDLYKMIQRGDITQSSFAFTISEQSWNKDKSLRSIDKVGRLLDVSPVTYPAYAQASVMARSEFAAAQEPQVEDKEVCEEQVEDKPKVEKSEVRKLHNTNTKNMTLKDLKAQRSEYYNEFVAIGNTADAEGRVMTEAEQERSDKLDGMIADLDIKIKHKTREQEMVARMAQGGTASTSEQREVERVHGAFSISRAVAQVANGRNLEGAEAEWAQEANKEARSQGLQLAGQIAIPSIALRALGDADEHSATTGSGTGFIPTAVPAAIEALRAPTVIEQLGTTVIRNATGTLQFPRVATKASGFTATEAGATTASGLLLDNVTMQPERVSAKSTYTKQLILQGGGDVDRLIANDLSAAMNAYIDDRAFDVILADTDVDDQSTGGANTDMTASLAVAMESAVLAAGGNLAGARYAMSPEAYRLAKNVAQVDSVTALFDLASGTFNGYPATATPYLVNAAGPLGQMVFGNFSQGLLLAYFGGLDLLVDPYSAAGNAQVTLHVNRFFDVAIRQPGAFSIVTDCEAAA
jgi:HK97 family phage prohead protease/HK97 family phage major capsid protein